MWKKSKPYLFATPGRHHTEAQQMDNNKRNDCSIEGQKGPDDSDAQCAVTEGVGVGVLSSFVYKELSPSPKSSCEDFLGVPIPPFLDLPYIPQETTYLQWYQMQTLWNARLCPHLTGARNSNAPVHSRLAET